MHDELIKERVELHHRLLLGNPENMKEMPGIVAEQMRTNEILTKLTETVSRINWMIVTGFVMALGALVIKGFSSTQ